MKMNAGYVSGVAIGQWKSVTAKGGLLTKNEATFKVLKAYVLGVLTFVYPSGEYIIKYYNVNLLVSGDGTILTAWKNDNTNPVEVDEFRKKNLSKLNFGEVKLLAIKKHSELLSVMKNNAEVK